jgi:O-antigen/teichoic acid export membrane protein
MMSSRYATAVMLPIAITFLLRGKSFIGLWMGSEYANVCGQVLSILTLAWLFSAGNSVVGAVMLGQQAQGARTGVPGGSPLQPG